MAEGPVQASVNAAAGVLGKGAETGLDAAITALKATRELKGAVADVAQIGVGAADDSLDAMIGRLEAMLGEVNGLIQRTLGNE